MSIHFSIHSLIHQIFPEILLYPKPGAGGGKVENDDTESLNLEYKMSPSGNKRQELAQDQQSQGGPEESTLHRPG